MEHPSAATLAVVPCLNEERTIASVVSGVRRHLSTVLVVDDGSTDATGAEAAAAGATVWRHAHPQGKGAALRNGARWALEHGFDWALFLDGDGQHDPAEIPQFLAGACEADLVVGNRMADCASMPWLRRQANRWSSRQLSRRLGMDIPDAQCGYRLARLAAWQAAGLQADGYEIEAEMLVQFRAAGLAIKFVPIRTIYGGERSKFHPLRDAWRWWRWWRRIQAGETGRRRRKT